MTAPRHPAPPDAIQSAILKRLPDADFSDVTILGKGIATTAYRFTDPSGQWVARVSNRYPAPWTWRGGRRYEVPLLRELNRLAQPVPRDPFEITEPEHPPVAIIERRVPGAPLGDLPIHHTDRFARQIADFLSSLHSIPLKTARSFSMPEVRVCDELRAAFRRADSLLDTPTRAWIHDEITRLEHQDLPASPIHADFRPDHWYCDADHTLVGVIDFGDSSIDDPALDFARFPDNLRTAFLERVLAHYNGPAGDNIAERAQIYQRLNPLFEVADADDAEWWDRDEALLRLTNTAQHHR